MLNEQTVATLNSLKLFGMAKSFSDKTRSLNKQTLLELSSQDWIAHHQNVLLTGPTGVGKSYIACALGNFAARHGLTVLYLRAPRLFESLLQSKADGSHLKTLNRLAKVELPILDDLFLTALGDAERNDLLEIILEENSDRSKPALPDHENLRGSGYYH